MNLALTDDEAAALASHLQQALGYARFPLAARLSPLNAILVKLEPPKPQPERLPPLTPGMWAGVADDDEDGRVKGVR